MKDVVAGRTRTRSFGLLWIVAAVVLAVVMAAMVLAWSGGRQAEAQTGPPDLSKFQKVVLAQGTGIGEVMELTVAPDGRVFFINRAGDILMYEPEGGTTEIVMNNPELGVWSGLEDGGLGITLDPNFEQNNHIYVYYAPLPEEYKKNRLSRFTVGEDAGGETVIRKSTEKVLLEVETQRNVCCHSAGSLQFDSQGNLYLSTGDNTSSSDNDGYSPHDERPGRSDYDAQKSSANTNDLRGKIVRIKPLAEPGDTPGIGTTYTIPDGNMFGEGGQYPTAKYPGADASKTRPEIYVMGLRNPYRLSLDPDTDVLYWGEVGPDSRSNSPIRGPRHHEEFNRTAEPMNGGWPYCGGEVGEDLSNQDFGGAYTDWDFVTNQPRRNPDGSLKRFPCNDPTGMRGVNDSPNSTGLQDLPPMTNPIIPYSDVPPYKYPEVQGGTPTANQVYRQSKNTNAKDTAFPAYYEGSWFIAEMSRGWIKEVRLDEQGRVQSINNFMDGFWGPSDIEFGTDGSMYVLEYGSSFFSGSPETKLVRIDYAISGRAPVAKASADKTEGAPPLAVNFSSNGTSDPDGDQLTYKWDFGVPGTDADTSTQPNPSYTYEQPGDYSATLTVTDPTNKTATAQVTVNVGNTRPQVRFEQPIEGGFFDAGDDLRFKVNVTDAEDAQIDCSKVTVQEGFGHDSHVHPGLSTTGCEGILETAASSDHGPEANTYGVLSARYSDGGANNGANGPLTGQDVITLQPKLRQAEHASGRQGVGFVGYDDKSGTKPGGGALITGMGNGNWISFDPMSLSRMDSVDLTYSGNPGAGARVELRAGAVNGPVVASVPLDGNSGGLYFYKTVSAEITSREADAGGRPLFFVYAGSGEMNFDQIRFNGTGVAANVAPTIRSATATPNEGPAPLEVDFAATADDADGDAVSYSWDFGDGTAPAGGANATHTYEQPGTYAAKVTATDATGESSEKSVEVVVRRPCAAAPAPDEGYTLLFNGRDLTGWKQAGPGRFTVEDCEMTSVGGLGMLWYNEKQFQDYSLKLQFRLSDDTDNSGVFHRFPDAGTDPWVAINQGHEVQIREGTATDGEPQKTGSIYNFDREDARNARPTGEWNDYEIQVVGQTYTVFLNGQKVNEYTSDGSRGTQGFIGLQNHGTADTVSFRTIQIKELDVEEPFVNTLSGNKVRGPAPLTVDYTADAVDRQGDAVTYEWDFGVPGTDADKATGKDVSYTYEQGGTYTATVTPVDAKGNRGMTREARPVTVEVAPVVRASADPSCGAPPLAVRFSGSATDPQGQDVTYEWDFGVEGTDTDTSTEQNPSYTYDEVGAYTATLTATDPDGNRGMAEVPISVREDGRCTATADLSQFFNNDAISTNENPADGNFDNAGWAFAADTLPQEALPDGGVVTLSGVPYLFPSPADGKKNSVETAGQTVPLPAGRYGRLMVLASSHHGDSRTIATVAYADGSTEQVPLNFTDWASGARQGDKVEIAMPHRHDANGDTGPPVNIFSQAVPINPQKELRSIKLPNEPKLHIFAITATDAGAEEPPPPPPPVRDCERSDEFDGDALLKERWNRILREDASLYSLSGGALRIETGPGELQDAAPNLIMQDAPAGAFTATTKVTIPTTTEGQQAGMVLRGANGDFLKLAFVRKSDSGDKWVEFLRSANGQFDFSGNWHSGPGGGFGGPFLPADFGDTVHLRLSTTDGETFKGEFSKDGQAWESAGDDRQGFAEQSFGVYALRGAASKPVAEAAFEDFKVTPDKPCASNGAPTATDDAATTDQGEPVEIPVLANDSDPDAGDDLSVVGLTQPANGNAAVVAGGSVRYEPRAGFSGTDTFTYKASDGEAESGPATVTVTVRKVDAPPPPPPPPPADRVKPTITGERPRPNSTVRDTTPAIEARVRDNRTNLTKDDIRLHVDGKRISAFTYGARTDLLRYVPNRQMKPGRHTVRIVARDDAGNTATETWRFRVERRR